MLCGAKGGLVGASNNTTMINCYNLGNIGLSNILGGLIGRIDGDSNIKNCYNKGELTNGGNVGGIAGSSTNSVVMDCYNLGNIGSSQGFVGGICGFHKRKNSKLL